MKATTKLFTFDEAYNLESKDVNRLYKEKSNIKLPDIYNKFSFGLNVTYQSETYGTATETETEEFGGSPNARAGKIDSYTLLNIYGGYEINDNYRIKAGVNNATDLEYIATRHPHGARAGAPLTAYIKAIANF